MDKRLSLSEIREFDLFTYLTSLGYQPEHTKRNGAECWYLSPLRNESEASFKVNRHINRWYDFGLGKGGNLIDFGLRYFNCTIVEFLNKFVASSSFDQPRSRQLPGLVAADEEHHKIIISGERKLCAYPLIQYLNERKIKLSVADTYCKEVTYELDGRSYFGIGFKNNAGGHEIRNAYFKCSSSPKEITTIGNDSGVVHIFEGFFDFLSFKTAFQNDPSFAGDCLILNGASMLERARNVLESYPVKKLWLDRDTTGIAYTQYALSLDRSYQDESINYKEHKDLNEWLVKQGPVLKKRLRPKIN